MMVAIRLCQPWQKFAPSLQRQHARLCHDRRERNQLSDLPLGYDKDILFVKCGLCVYVQRGVGEGGKTANSLGLVKTVASP